MDWNNIFDSIQINCFNKELQVDDLLLILLISIFQIGIEL